MPEEPTLARRAAQLVLTAALLEEAALLLEGYLAAGDASGAEGARQTLRSVLCTLEGHVKALRAQAEEPT